MLIPGLGQKTLVISTPLELNYNKLLQYTIYLYAWIVDMINIDRQLIPSFKSHKIAYKKSEIKFVVLLKKVIAILRSIF